MVPCQVHNGGTSCNSRQQEHNANIAKADIPQLQIHWSGIGCGHNKQTAEQHQSPGVVDCNNAGKTYKYIEKIKAIRPFDKVAFICATHPHLDHIRGIRELMTDPLTRPEEFWDCGFRHHSSTYLKILRTVRDEGLQMRRISSGMEWYFGSLRITALSPSVRLRNRYATFGVDMNNASVVLRLEHHGDDVLLIRSQEYKGKVSLEAEREAGRSVVILAGDAEFDSWACVTQEYPKRERRLDSFI